MIAVVMESVNQDSNANASQVFIFRIALWHYQGVDKATAHKVKMVVFVSKRPMEEENVNVTMIDMDFSVNMMKIQLHNY